MTDLAVLPDLAGVPALTLHQPWAHAIAHLGKRVENRCWKPPARVTRILIHAGRADSPAGWVMLRQIGFSLHDIHPAGVPHSAIVAVADLAGVCEDAIDGGPCDCGRWAASGQYHWRLDVVRPLARPVEHVRGRQRLWYPSADVLAQVQAAGVEAAR